MIDIRPVVTRRDHRRFLRLPEVLYRNDPYWVRPLRVERNLAVDTHNNAFYARAQLQMFLAYDGNRPVGRIAAILNEAHNAHHNEKTGFFGFYETQDDREISRALLDAVQSWHRDRGMREVRGPVNPSMNAECGTLIEGFDASPALLMPYNPRYYPEHLQACGYEKEIDLLAYAIPIDSSEKAVLRDKRLERIVAALKRKKPSLRIRPFDRKNFRRDAFLLRELFDEARRRNYGFVPSTDREFETMVSKMQRMLDPELALLVEIQHRPVACVVGVPDWNIAIRRSAGTPEPFRLVRLLWEKRNIDNVRVIAVSIAEEYRHSGLMALLMLELINVTDEKGYARVELSWVAEDNTVNIRTLERTFGVKPFKRYRIYRRSV